MEISLLAVMPGLFIWIAIVLLPWRPWSTRESLDSQSVPSTHLSDVTVLIPARNEALTITDTLAALKSQGTGLNVVLVDDQSTDDTAKIANAVNLEHLSIITGTELAKGWSGKLWALEQGRQQVKTPWLILFL